MTVTKIRLLLQIHVLALLVLAAASCQYLEEVLPTISAPSLKAEPTATPLDESPRLRERQEIPPTWTPPANLASETPVAPNEVAPQSGSQTSYTVQPGDTLAEIALRFNVPIDELARVNNIEDFDHIEIDQVLIIPGF